MLFYSFYNFCFSPFTETLQVCDTTMCHSPWSVVYAAICTYNAKDLKKNSFVCRFRKII